MVPNSRNRREWLCLILALLTMLLLAPAPPSQATLTTAGDRPHVALKCLVGSYCGDAVDMMP